jgi:Putative Actinobacterial Holin-X, holin superfamily III
MSDRTPNPDPTTAAAPSGDLSTGELVGRLSEQTSLLIRSELQLAQAEMQEKAKHVGLGAGLFGTAGIIALFGLGVLVTTGVLALDLVLPAWLAALIVAVVLFAVAGVAALVGKKQVAEAAPLAPERAIDGVKQDVATVKEARQ